MKRGIDVKKLSVKISWYFPTIFLVSFITTDPPKTKFSDVVIPFSGVNIILTKVASACCTCTVSILVLLALEACTVAPCSYLNWKGIMDSSIHC